MDRTRHVVLVVDDNDGNRYAVARGLRAAGYQTLETGSGAQALELAPRVSALVLDVNLPDVHGFEICRLLRARPETHHLPIIHMTSKSLLAADRATSFAAGATAYMVLPLDPGELAQKLDLLIA